MGLLPMLLRPQFWSKEKNSFATTSLLESQPEVIRIIKKRFLLLSHRVLLSYSLHRPEIEIFSWNSVCMQCTVLGFRTLLHVDQETPQGKRKDQIHYWFHGTLLSTFLPQSTHCYYSPESSIVVLCIHSSLFN